MSTVIDLSQFFSRLTEINRMIEAKAAPIQAGRFLEGQGPRKFEAIMGIGKRHRCTFVVFTHDDGQEIANEYRPDQVYFVLPGEDVIKYVEHLGSDSVLFVKEIT